jgi:hypothetical protein
MDVVGHIPSSRGDSLRFSGCVPVGRTSGSGVGITALYTPERRRELPRDTMLLEN